MFESYIKQPPKYLKWMIHGLYHQMDNNLVKEENELYN